VYPDNLVIVPGMPRSGTSWLGQILESHPDVAYRVSPLFSYVFKNRLEPFSSRADWEEVLRGSFETDNAFMLSASRRASGDYPEFRERSAAPTHLVLKFDRHQDLVRSGLTHFPAMKVVGIVRHPCGVINSWLRAPREFPPTADPLEHWRSGAIKKVWRGDFFGFDDWKWVARELHALRAEFPERVMVVRYEELVRDRERLTQAVFAFLGLSMHRQTSEFLDVSRASQGGSEYSVFKDPAVAYQWREQLQPEIREAILEDLAGTDLACYLAD
jgi:hypothetical protein